MREIAQLISIAAHGNVSLTGKPERNFFPDNPVFDGSRLVTFVDPQNSPTKWREPELAADPLAWFEKLGHDGVIQLRVRYEPAGNANIPDGMCVAAEEKSRWLIETVKQAHSDFWEARWDVGDRSDPERKYMNVKYGCVLKNANLPEPPRPAVTEVKEELEEILRKISAFAYKHRYGEFGGCFDRGITALSAPPSRDSWACKILPANYAAPDYCQLLNACESAWVFGGPGSWNDMYFDGDAYKEYGELSESLYNLIYLALYVASNPLPRPIVKS